MPKRLLARALDSLPVNPVEYVKSNYKTLKKTYGDDIVALRGLKKSAGSVELIARGADVDLRKVGKMLGQQYLLDPITVVGTIDDIFYDRAKELVREIHPALGSYMGNWFVDKRI